jgi:hypothetical protein
MSGVVESEGPFRLSRIGLKGQSDMKDLVLNVNSYGAKGDGITNDTAAIQAAIDACAAAGGGIVWFPLGRYKTTRSLLVRAGAIALVGTGYASVIAPEGSFDTVVIQSNVLGTFLSGNRVIDLYFDEAGKTGGRTLYAERVAEFAAQSVTATSGYNGLAFSVYNSIVLADVRLTYYRGGLGAAYLRLTSGPTPSDRADVAWVRDCIFSTDQPRLSVGMKGVDIDGFVHTVNLSKVGIGVSGAEALIARNSLAAANVPTFITANDLEIEFSQLECIRLDAGIKCSFATSMLHGSVLRDNVYVGSACRNIDFTGGTSTGACQSGIAVAGRDVSITSMRFDTNCQLNITGPYPGILVGGTSNGVVVTGCRSGSLDTPNSQRYGIQVDTGADNFCIVGNVFTNNRLGSHIIGTTLAANRVYASNAG